MIAAERLRALVGAWLPRAEWSGVTGCALVACSGGADSLALLALAVASGLDLVAVHVDHGLRPGSATEASLVAAAAGALGVRSVASSVDLLPGTNLEARAREARLGALEAERARLGAEAILLAHTADDQAETVLLNLLRGAATTGLAGIPPRRGRLVRPLLRLRRADTVEICARLGWAPFEDPMNCDPAFRRVWLRREALPMLSAGSGRDLSALLARQADVLREESDLLDALADHELARLRSGPGASSLPAEAVGLTPALARRVVRRWLAGSGAPPSLDDVEAVLAVGSRDRRAAELRDGRRVERAGGAVWVTAPQGADPSARDGEHRLSLPGSAVLGDLHFDTWVERAAPVTWPDGRWTCVLDADVVGDAVVLRRCAPAERFRPLGLAGTKPVSEVLAEAGVPPARRGGALVLATPAGTPLWLLGYRVGALGGVGPTTRRYLWLRVQPTTQPTTQPTVGALP